jgi:hypothetical protein
MPMADLPQFQLITFKNNEGLHKGCSKVCGAFAKRKRLFRVVVCRGFLFLRGCK